MITPPGTFQFLLIVLPLIAGAMIGCANARLGEKPPPPPFVTLKITNYCPKQGYIYKDHFLWNENSSFNGSYWDTDSDGDGLSDAFEQDVQNFAVYGTSWLFLRYHWQ